MSIRKKVVFFSVLVVLATGIIIAHIWFGLFSSPEYYKGFDWNTDKKQLEWRLSKEHYWKDDEYKTNTTKLEEDLDIWFHDSFLIDKKTQKLKEIRFVYLVEDNAKMEQVYANEVDELKRRLGRGTEGEAGDALFTEWRGKHSIIRVIKQDCEYEDLNTCVEVVYQDKGEYNEPYFTETHLWQGVYEKMIDSFYCVSTPEYDADTIRASKNNDYSAYKLRPTDETKKVIALMNKYLFSGEDKGIQVARRIASSKGITVENPLSVDWVMKHPAKTLLILRHLTREKDFFKSKSEIDKAYNLLTEEEQQRA